MPLKPWALAVISLFVLGLTSLVVSNANAQDNMAYKDWPQQSRADRLGTFTYVYGGGGFVSHSGDEGADYPSTVVNPDGTIESGVAAEEDDDGDIFVTGGFGVRLPNEFNFEFGASMLGGAYIEAGSEDRKPEDPIFEMSVLKSFDLGGPPLLRYTARFGLAFGDDKKAGDGTLFAVGVAHEPFRVELRNYEFDNFESQVLSVSYIYDF
jgi:hypothetical protein